MPVGLHCSGCGWATFALRLRCIAVSAAPECRQKKSGQCPLKILFLSPIMNGFHHELYSNPCPCQSGQRLVKKCTALPASACYNRARLRPGQKVIISTVVSKIKKNGRVALYRVITGLLKRKLAINRFMPTGGVK